MSDLERLTEALAEWSHSYLSLEPVLAAARAYRDLLANGERVEPDYEAAAVVLAGKKVPLHHGIPDPGPETRRQARCIVNAAIGSRLLIVPPTEEER